MPHNPTRKRTLFRLLLCATVAIIPQVALSQVYLDSKATVDQRVDDLVGRMTLPEKAAQMQNVAPAIPRLGVPAYDWWNEGLHGVARAGEATVFPQAMAMAATWDTDMMTAEGRTVGTEGRARYNQAQREGNTDRYFGLTFWSPNINILRDPRWGRGQETLGEDPYLTGTMATAFVRGLQGEDPEHPLAIATPKHFAVHSGPEPLRHGFNVDATPRDLSETYLPAFRRTVTEGHAQSLMCAYNAIDGAPACASNMLLKTYLRDGWGFKGFVTSDCGAIDDIVSGHHFAKDYAEAAALAVKAGADTDCSFRDEYLALPEAVSRGLISEAEVDMSVKRLFATRVRLGMFDTPDSTPYGAVPISENHSDAHKALALKAAQESIVLLKNTGLLPLASSVRKIAVIGPSATSLSALEGNYKGTAVGAVLPLEGMRNTFGTQRIIYAQGSPYVEQVSLPVPETVFGKGLTASFWNGTGFAGPIIATRTDGAIQFDWNAVSPAPGVDPHAFSARWSGTISVPAPGDYVFEVGSDGCDPADNHETYELQIEGAAVTRGTASCETGSKRAGPLTIHFSDTRLRTFSLNYTHRSPRFGAGITLSWQPPVDILRDEAVKAARQADMVVAFVGLNPNLEGEEMPLKIPGFEGGDRTSLALPAPQIALIKALEATGKPVVIVLQSGSAVALGDLSGRAGAILQSWYGGEAGGQAIADVLSGKVNPSGRLPSTFYASVDQIPKFTEYSMAGRTYRYFKGKPEYPFGHGLSYSRFAYSGLAVDAPAVEAGKDLTVSAMVRNTSRISGDEVVQIYLSTPDRPDTPIRSLKGFKRVSLGAGETSKVSFTLSARDMSFADEDGQMRVKPVRYLVWVGGGQPDSAPGIAGSFQVTGSTTVPR